MRENKEAKVEPDVDEEPSTSSSALSPNTKFSFASRGLSNKQCLDKLLNFTTIDDFSKAIPKLEQLKFVKAAMASLNGALECKSCQKLFNTAIGFTVHVSKCRGSRLQHKQEAHDDETSDVEDRYTETPPPTRTGSSENPERTPTNQAEDSPGEPFKYADFSSSSSQKKVISRIGRPRKEENVSQHLTFEVLKEEPSLWFHLPDKKREDTLKAVFTGKDKYECFGRHNDQSKKFEFDDLYAALGHINKCCNKPMLNYYKGTEGATAFRALDSIIQARYVREAIGKGGSASCLCCPRVFSHHYGLLYHIQRCGLQDHEKPWKCYRCKYMTTAQFSQEHLANCWKEDRAAKEAEAVEVAARRLVKETARKEANEKPAVMGTLCDVNLRSGKNIAKEAQDILVEGESFSSSVLTAQDALLMLLNAEDNKRRLDTNQTPPNLPPNSKRIRLNPQGALRYKFRRSDMKTTNSTHENGIRGYGALVGKTNEKWIEDALKIPLTAAISRLAPSVWTQKSLPESDSSYASLSRTSLTLRLPRTFNQEEEKTLPIGTRIECLKSVQISEEEDGKETGSGKSATVAFCGNPINSVQLAPNRLPNGDAVLCVCTFPNEEHLDETIDEGGDLEELAASTNSSAVVQFWRLASGNGDSTETKISMNVWFVLHLPNRGTVLAARWLDKPVDEQDDNQKTLIGFLALATTHGEVLVYRIDSDSVALSSDDNPPDPDGGSAVQVVQAEPQIVLKQNSKPLSCLIGAEGHATNGDVPCSASTPQAAQVDLTEDETPRIPLISLAWCAESGGRNLVAVNAAGSLVVWDLDSEDAKPRILLDPEWISPALDVAFVSQNRLAVAFRERYVRVYDTCTWQSVVEEGAIRTAGAKVATEPRVFDGLITYQSDFSSCFSATTFAMSSINYMATGSGESYFVVPLSNAHELMAWNAAICQHNGAIVSCGSDGKVMVSSNGRILPRGHKNQLAFDISRTLLQLTRRKIGKPDTMVNIITTRAGQIKAEPLDEDFENDATKSVDKVELMESFTTHDAVCANMWLDVAFLPNTSSLRQRLPFSCRDQRIESLNAVTFVSTADSCVAVAGGEAGLLFALPAYILERSGSVAPPTEPMKMEEQID